MGLLLTRVSRDELQGLSQYKYSVQDHSLVSKYILQPYWNYCIRFVPGFLAPNLVTLIGFAALVVNYITICVYLPQLEGTAPLWVYLAAAIGIQWYSLLDNLDGRQARRTQTSSPLGELFDHGCDCMAVPLGAVIGSAITQIGTGWMSITQLIVMASGFFFATWEEYHTGSLYLGIINGPTEGIQVIATIYFLSYWFGPGFWSQPYKSTWGLSQFAWADHLPDLTVSEVAFLGFVIPMLVTIFFNTTSVFSHLAKQRKSRWTAVGGLVPLFTWVSLCILWRIVSPELWERYPIAAQTAAGLCIGELTSRLITAHLTRQKVALFPRPLLLFSLVVVLSRALPWFYPDDQTVLMSLYAGWV